MGLVTRRLDSSLAGETRREHERRPQFPARSRRRCPDGGAHPHHERRTRPGAHRCVDRAERSRPRPPSGNTDRGADARAVRARRRDAVAFHPRSQPAICHCEGLWAGLPLLISERCGNAPEVVRPGLNGWTVNPADPASMRAAVVALANASSEDLAAMGAQSMKMAEENFPTYKVLEGFADALAGLDNAR